MFPKGLSVPLLGSPSTFLLWGRPWSRCSCSKSGFSLGVSVSHFTPASREFSDFDQGPASRHFATIGHRKHVGFLGTQSADRAPWSAKSKRAGSPFLMRTFRRFTGHAVNAAQVRATQASTSGGHIRICVLTVSPASIACVLTTMLLRSAREELQLECPFREFSTRTWRWAAPVGEGRLDILPTCLVLFEPVLPRL